MADHTDNELCSSPLTLDNSFDSDMTYQTPVTSPEASPHKPLLKPIDDNVFSIVPLQLDGQEEAKSKESSFLNKLRSITLSNHSPTSALRRRRGVSGGDRFITGRFSAPTKQRYLLSKPGSKPKVDPFISPVSRTVKADQQFTVTRFPGPAPRAYGRTGSQVQRPSHGVNANVTWTVGRLPVTEGVASTSNGRSGRITSGSNAPMFNANMAFSSQKPDEKTLHEQRLAMAMDMDHAEKVIDVGNENSKTEIDTEDVIIASQDTVWKDSRWYTSNASGKAASNKDSSIPNVPFKVLEAQELRNDYYCSLMAYSPILNCLAVGINNNVFIWVDQKKHLTSNIEDCMMFPHHYSHITSISFSSKVGGKSILAVGCADGHLTLWHPKATTGRLSCDQPIGVSNVCFRPIPSRRPSARDSNIMVETEELLVGMENGNVLLYSVEWPDQDECDLFDWSRSMILRTIIRCNNQQICGMAWSAVGEMFATGGNDNQLFVFDFHSVDSNALHKQQGDRRTVGHNKALKAGLQAPPVVSGAQKQLFQLNAAVKAIAFAPWQHSLLAARGGSNDRCIHFFHATTGARLATINCHAQVTSLIWNENRKQIAATLGFAQPDHPYRVIVFAWPTCEQLVSIVWPGEERALYGVSYPGRIVGKKNDCIVVATSDHSIKFHEIWPESKKSKATTKHAKSQILDDVCSPALEAELNIR